jgi:hypothetical protein
MRRAVQQASALQSRHQMIAIIQKVSMLLGFVGKMSGSKRPSASVASFRNNVEEDFTVSASLPAPPPTPHPHNSSSPLSTRPIPTGLSFTIPQIHVAVLYSDPVWQLFTVRCQIQNEVWQVERRYSMFDSIHRKLQVRALQKHPRTRINICCSCTNMMLFHCYFLQAFLLCNSFDRTWDP